MTKEELRKKHGTPAEFEKALWAAWADLFITMEEAMEARAKYNDEWGKADD
jgi:hypothetical protein